MLLVVRVDDDEEEEAYVPHILTVGLFSYSKMFYLKSGYVTQHSFALIFEVACHIQCFLTLTWLRSV